MLQEKWHPKQRLVKSEQNELHLEIPYSNDTELLMDIFRWGSLAKVLSPPELRTKAIEQLKTTLKSYK